MAAPFTLLDLPRNVVLTVFQQLAELADAVALSSCCKELHALGAAAHRRAVCCAACVHELVPDAAAALGSNTHSHPRLRLPDSTGLPLDAECCSGCRLSEERKLEILEPLYSLRVELGIPKAGDEGHSVRAQEVLCGGCNLHVGLRIVQLSDQRAGVPPVCFRHWRELEVLRVCFLGRAYLRLCAPDGREEWLGRPSPPATLVHYACTGARSQLRKVGGCGAVLFQGRAVLSRQHRWDAGSGPERAWLVHALLPGAVVARDERQEELCQGSMRVADAYCSSCGGRIGWRFCADLSQGLGNCSQVGRYGVVKSSIVRVPSGGGNAGGSPSASNQHL